MADHPAPCPVYDIEAGIASLGLPPPTVKPDWHSFRLSRATPKQAPKPATSGHRPQPRLSPREAFKHFCDDLPSRMLVHVAY